ncbi:L-arabinonate dehydratase [Luteitalea pratensis]|uniref:L-arabinonate dehydratase n=1 Tax=Luteitalea pratensis TaxID=1855912 RepID=UPI000D73EA64|nr:L-arabinonate dehydratase [Luteitalea pratensis]
MTDPRVPAPSGAPGRPARRAAADLRSQRWFAPDDLRSFGHRSRLRQLGYSADDAEGKPVIAILNTWSDLQQCHGHFRERAEDVKQGVWQAGGFPVEMPVLSLSEMFVKPTAMFYRNLLALEVEEILRSHPIDGVVLMGGCDKTVPGLIMGAISMNLPAIFVPAGPMLAGRFRTERLGSGTDVWKYWNERKAGNLDECALRQVEEGIARSPGTCMTMGTASTMASITEALGLTLTGAATIPAVHSAHARMATAAGRRAVELVWEDLRPSAILTADAFRNGVVTDMALCGSTNAIIHLIAMARRAGVPLTLEDFDRISREVPVVVNLRPAGEFLMEDFHDAGGVPALLSRLRPHLALGCRTVGGSTIGEVIAGAEVLSDEVIRPLDRPLARAGGTFVLRGNLAPDGCVIKPTAAEPRLLKHTGPALVFATYADLKARIDQDDLDVTPDHVVVLQNAGPVGAPGMPEWGMLPIPKKLLQQGIRDMVRISDARMSGTSYGTCVLHVAPEAAVGGPLALVRDGDLIEIDVEARRIHLHVADEELAARKATWSAPPRRYERGYSRLFLDQTSQAPDGCDFTFLEGGWPTPEPDIY